MFIKFLKWLLALFEGHSAPPPVVTVPPSTPPSPTPPPTPVPPASASDGLMNFLAGAQLYVNPSGVVAQFVKNTPHDPNISLLQRISEQPTFIWLTGGTPSEVYNQVKDILQKAVGSMVGFVLYNIPNRDNGGPSHGGAVNEAAYESWVGAIDAAVKDSGNPRTVFVVEPDAIGFAAGSTDEAFKAKQYETIQIATDILNQNPGRSVYLGVSMWQSDPANMIKALQFMKTQDHLKNIRGFALNPSGYTSTERCKAFGDMISVVTGYHYIIDTGRNGNGGVDGQWENVPGQALGAKPLTDVPTQNYDGNVWIKPPGESDGPNNGAPDPGQFYYNGAVEMSRNAKWSS